MLSIGRGLQAGRWRVPISNRWMRPYLGRESGAATTRLAARGCDLRGVARMTRARHEPSVKPDEAEPPVALGKGHPPVICATRIVVTHKFGAMIKLWGRKVDRRAAAGTANQLPAPWWPLRARLINGTCCGVSVVALETPSPRPARRLVPSSLGAPRPEGPGFLRAAFPLLRQGRG